METVQVKRSRPLLDMTPMVDLAFLLVTFFMLTTKFVAEEPIVVDTPSSISDLKLPETDMLTISMASDGRVFFNVDGRSTREKLLQKIAEKYGVTFSSEEAYQFSVLSSMGMPMGSLKSYLDISPEERKSVFQPGIPCDSLHNELADWIVFSRMANPKVRIALKGDKDVAYPVVKRVLNTLQDSRINRFNMITDLEKTS
uniref:Biopolymer transporter ExbD n=1 Tax=Roseihalotalea indica TaxID=2867963 RepID=A0AA49GQU8_9BACT|nr:biopolymer transporter ExbD [Tunicatimonas sp. TK19036]